MKKCGPLFLAAIVIAVLSLTLFAQGRESTPQIRQQTFEHVWKTVDKKFFDPKFGGLNWNEVRERYAPLAAAVKTDAELYELLDKMLGELRTSHLEIVPPEQLEKTKDPPVMTGLGLKELDGQVVVFRIWKHSSAAESALRPGFIIKTMDGEPVKTIDDAFVKLYGKVNTKVSIGCLDEKDELREITLERRLIQPGDVDKESIGNKATLYAIFESRRLADDIGYIHFTSFLAPLQIRVRMAIRSMHDAPGIIIDLRGNGGGDDAVGLEMANALFEKKTLLMITRTRKGDDNYYRARPVEDPYTGKVVILLDKGSASASEQFAAGMQEAGRAVVVGNKTNGEDMDAGAALLPTGALFIYPYGQPRTPKGVVIEGRGVIPDLEVSLSRKDLLAGTDSQLEAAIDFIKTGKK
jgi:carboxyl-terminal processing protease